MFSSFSTKIALSGVLVQPEQVHACLAYILKNERKTQSNECIGSLTSLGRDDWAKVCSSVFPEGAV